MGQVKNISADLLDDSDEVSCEPWRWGHNSTRVAKVDGEHWMFTVQVHSEDGWQDFFGQEIECKRVRPEPVTTTEWVEY